MNAQIRQFIEENEFHVATVKQLAEMLPTDDAELDAWIAETVKDTDRAGFMFLTVAAASRERRMDARHLARGAMIFPYHEWVGGVALRMYGDVPEHLLDAISNTTLSPSCEAAALFLSAVWCQEHRAGVVPDKLIPTARALARRAKADWTAMGLLVALGLRLNDAGLSALLKQHLKDMVLKPWPEMETHARDFGEKWLTARRNPILETVSEKPCATLAAGSTLRRAVARLGRNDPCHCGSGRKYKHCCHDKDVRRLRHSSEVAGLTQEELEAEPEPHLTAARLEKAEPFEVVGFDPTRIPPKLLETYFLRLSLFHLLDRAVEALEMLGYSQKLEVAWGHVLAAAARARRQDVGRRLMKLRAPSGFTDDKLGLGGRLLLAQDDPAKCLQLIEESAQKTLQTENDHELLALAYGVTLSQFPGLGILLSRGVLPLVTPRQMNVGYVQLLEARDRLNLPPDDPISDLVDKKLAEGKDDESRKDAAALRKAQRSLDAKAREVRELKEELDRLQREVTRREKKPATAPAASARTAPVEEGALKELREKVAGLKSALNARHTERNALRRDLQKAQADLEAIRQAAPPVEARANGDPATDQEEDLLLPQETDGNQPLRLVEYPRNFLQRLNEFPRHVARGAISMLGRLAAGEAAAFVGAVRLKACPSIIRQRIGIDHRLLFRLLPDRVQVVDLIPRQDLERKIKTLV